MKTDRPYTCVSCDFYDTLEIFAMRKNQVKVIYLDPSQQKHTLISTIKNLVTRDKEEYLIMLSDLEIRLDRILEINKVN